MTLQELAGKEDDLYSRVVDLCDQPQNGFTNKKLAEVYIEYKKVHQLYAELSIQNLEALKRGLFIQWYSRIEPSYLTGISELEESAESTIVQSLNHLMATRRLDTELIWMINYYCNWDWWLDGIRSFTGFRTDIVNKQNNVLPETINREEMKSRGQMGKYWNSLHRFQSV